MVDLTSIVLLAIPIGMFSHPLSCDVLNPVIPDPLPIKLPA